MNNCSKKLGINFDLTFQDIKNVNPSFDSAKIAIAYEGKNRNMSSISKEVFETALPTIKNVPLVGRYIEDEDDFGAHDIRVVVKGDEFDVQNATVPFGVVPESAEQWWEEVTEEDGTVRNYLFTDCLLWKRQPGYECLANQKKWHQSMEIDLNKYVVDAEGYCVIEDFTYTAFCILGNSVEPCFESASVQLTSDAAVSIYKQQFALMLADLKDEASKAETYVEEEPVVKITAEARDRILAEFNIKLEDVSFELTDDMTEEEFRTALTEMAEATPVEDPAPAEGTENPTEAPVEEPAETPNGEPVVEAEPPTPVVEQKSFSATYNQKRQALQNSLPVSDNVYCWLMDFDDSYVYYEQIEFADDDRTEINLRASYVFDIDTLSAQISSDTEIIICKWLTLEENAKVEADRALLEELKTFKQERLQADHENEIDLAVEEFADLEGIEEFETLKANAYSFENADALRKECYAIKGKREYAKPDNQNKKTVRVPIGVTVSGNDPVEALFATFSKK